MQNKGQDRGQDKNSIGCRIRDRAGGQTVYKIGGIYKGQKKKSNRRRGKTVTKTGGHR